MADDDPKPIRIQILAAKEDAGPAAHAISDAQQRMAEITDIARRQGAEALLVCPAPEEISEDGFNLIIYARFKEELDEDTVFWRQRSLGNEFRRGLHLAALVLDLDTPRADFLNHIEPLLAAPYRDEIGGRGGEARPDV
jgi:hypothetical protein